MSTAATPYDSGLQAWHLSYLIVNGQPHLGRRNALNITCDSLSQYHMQQVAEQ
jgi:hypothetical protein